MSDSNRGNEPAALGAFGYFTAVILCCLIVGYLTYTSGRQDERRDKAPTAYSQAAKEDARRSCLGIEGGAAFECIYEKVEASQEQAHNEQDLDAQQRAAFAALVSVIVAFLAFVATVAGVWFVKRTLDATLKAVEDTGKATVAMEAGNAIAAKSAAAFLAKERGRLCFYRQQISTFDGAKYLPFKIENTGHTECILIEIHYTIADHPVWPQPTICADLGSFVPSKTEEIIEDVSSDILTGHDAGYILGLIVYDGIAGMQYSAYFCYRFWRIGESDVGFEWADCEGLPRDT